MRWIRHVRARPGSGGLCGCPGQVVAAVARASDGGRRLRRRRRRRPPVAVADCPSSRPAPAPCVQRNGAADSHGSRLPARAQRQRQDGGSDARRQRQVGGAVAGVAGCRWVSLGRCWVSLGRCWVAGALGGRGAARRGPSGSVSSVSSVCLQLQAAGGGGRRRRQNSAGPNPTLGVAGSLGRWATRRGLSAASAASVCSCRRLQAAAGGGRILQVPTQPWACPAPPSRPAPAPCVQ